MPTSRLQIPHQLETAEAQRRILKFADATRQNPGSLITNIEDSWSGNTGTFRFSVLGMTISGGVKVEPEQVQIDLQYPLTALLFKSRIEQEILAKAGQLLRK